MPPPRALDSAVKALLRSAPPGSEVGAPAVSAAARAVESGSEMQVTVKGKQLDVGDALRSHIDDSLSGMIAKYFGDAVEATVVMTRDAYLFRSEISVHVGRNLQLNSTGEADEAYKAFDAAADRMAKRLRRYKRRLRDDHRAVQAQGAPLDAPSYVLRVEPETPTAEDAEASDQPVVIAEMTTPIESMTVSQAVMRLDLADLPALMFRNAGHGGLNMVYRRPDGNVGWVDPRSTPDGGA